MGFNALTPNAEKLLKEILDNRLDNGNCDTNYWANRFDNLSNAEDSQLRSTFKELSDAEMISILWASNVPYTLTVLNNGLSYFDIKKENGEKEKEEKRSDRRHDIALLIIGAILGGVVEFVLFKFFGIGG